MDRVDPQQVAIVLLNWNGSEDTRACVESLRRSDAAGARLVVFDNGSRPDDFERLRALEGIELLRSETNLGFAEGNNEAVRRLGGSWSTLVLLNNDTEVPATWLVPLLECLAGKAPALVSPAIRRGAPGDPEEWWFSGSRIDWWLGRPVLETDPPGSEPRRLPYVPGCCLAVHRDDWAALGGFEPAYFAYFEDTDLGLCASRRGIASWMEPRSTIHHKVSRATGEDHPFRIRLFCRNRLWFMRRFGPWWSWPTFLAIQVLLRIPYSLRYFRKPGGGARARAFLSGTAQGLFGKVVS
jgi:GT2 family glycosyltransferase